MQYADEEGDVGGDVIHDEDWGPTEGMDEDLDDAAAMNGMHERRPASQ